jgi:hypothetical protein
MECDMETHSQRVLIVVEEKLDIVRKKPAVARGAPSDDRCDD